MMTKRNNLIIGCGFLTIICNFIPSFLGIVYGYGAILLRWYFGFSLAGINWVSVWGFTLEHIFDIIFGLIVLGCGIIVLYLGLIEREYQEKRNYNTIIMIEFILIITTIIHTIIFYWESSLIYPMPIWIPIAPIILILIGIYLIKTLYKAN
ncbi:MAG: hypothetical protein KGD63_12655 [Candidatus Lokiarchaeota archaeon]|nr:hypothetical protein [Candidatus Lokiarchaeota archaeon]